MNNSLLSIVQKFIDQHSRKIFVGLLLLVYLFLNFQEYLFLHPVGPHFIRQTDSLSFVDYYQNHGFNFFETGGWYLGDSNGKAACEFPIIYYLIALLSSWLGEKELIFRLLTLGISSLGFFHLFRLTQLILKKNSLAFGFSLLFISSTIILYYSVNFLPDAAALGLTLSAWYFGIRYYSDKKKKYLWFAFCFYLMASWLKITYIIHPTALVGALFFTEFFQTKQFTEVLKKQVFGFIGLFAIFLLVLTWYFYAQYYNQVHGSSYFLTEITPIWSMNGTQISRTWLAIYHDWFSSYYYQTAFHVLLALIILGLASIKKVKIDFLVWVLIILGIGSLVYGLLFYRQFKDHDYYMLNFAPFLFFFVLVTFRNLLNRFTFIFSHGVFVLGVFVLTFLSLNYAKKKLHERYHLQSPLFEKNVEKLKGIDTYLMERGIPSQVNVIVFPEQTPNGAFYWIRRSGWNIIQMDKHGKKEFAKRLPQADYLLLTEGDPSAEMGGLTLIGEFNTVKLYRIGLFN